MFALLWQSGHTAPSPILTFNLLGQQLLKVGLLPGKHEEDDAVSKSSIGGIRFNAFGQDLSFGVGNHKEGFGVHSSAKVGGRELSSSLTGGRGRGNYNQSPKPDNEANAIVDTPFFNLSAKVRADGYRRQSSEDTKATDDQLRRRKTSPRYSSMDNRGKNNDANLQSKFRKLPTRLDSYSSDDDASNFRKLPARFDSDSSDDDAASLPRRPTRSKLPSKQSFNRSGESSDDGSDSDRPPPRLRRS